MKQIGLWLTACFALALLAACSAEVNAPSAAFETQAADPFEVERWYGEIPCHTSFHCFIGDADGNGRDDIIIIEGDVVQVYEAKRNSFGYFFSKQLYRYYGGWGDSNGEPHCSANFGTYFGVQRFEDKCGVGDFNNDGHLDIVAFKNGQSDRSNRALVALGETGRRGFGPPEQWDTDFCIKATETCLIGDINADGDSDVVLFQNGTYNSDDVYVRLSNGQTFLDPGYPWHENFCDEGRTCALGDVNGDGRDDIISFLHGPNAFGANGNVFVALSSGVGFGTKQLWHKNICFDGHICTVGDVNGDNLADLITFTGRDFSEPEIGVGPHEVYTALSFGTGFDGAVKSHDYFCNDFGGATCMVGQFTDDDKADILHTSGHLFGANPDKDTYVGESSVQ